MTDVLAELCLWLIAVPWLWAFVIRDHLVRGSRANVICRTITSNLRPFYPWAYAFWLGTTWADRGLASKAFAGLIAAVNLYFWISDDDDDDPWNRRWTKTKDKVAQLASSAHPSPSYSP